MQCFIRCSSLRTTTAYPPLSRRFLCGESGGCAVDKRWISGGYAGANSRLGGIFLRVKWRFVRNEPSSVISHLWKGQNVESDMGVAALNCRYERGLRCGAFSRHGGARYILDSLRCEVLSLANGGSGARRVKRGEGGGRPETRSEGRNGQDARCPSTPPRWRLTIRADVLGMGAGSSTNAMLRRDEVIAPYHSAACTFRGCARIFCFGFFRACFCDQNCVLYPPFSHWRDGRVAEGSGLLNRHTD